MFVELIESLRCPHAHEETQLVASSSRTESRHIVEGMLGCPVCGAEFRVSNGQVRFDDPVAATPPERASAETAMRLAAFLELTDARGFAILVGRWGAHADQIMRLSDATLVLVNPPEDAVAAVAAVAAVVWTRDALPFTAAAARAAALDDGMSAAFVQSVVRAVRVGGRVVGPASLALPPTLSELVRDEHAWVAEKTGAPPAARQLVSITRTPR